MIRATCPIRAESLNRTNAEHWARRHKRNTSHRLEVYVALRQAVGLAAGAAVWAFRWLAGV
jgi:hypothetical protein